MTKSIKFTLKICLLLVISSTKTHQSKIRTPKELDVANEKKPVDIETIKNLYSVSFIFIYVKQIQTFLFNFLSNQLKPT